MTDSELLEQHRQGAKDAFAQLVRRHIDWVYSAARRRVNDAHLAEDVTQAVFEVLARKMPRLKPGQTLSIWLFGVLNLTCKALLRKEARRHRHETEAAKMRSSIDTTESEKWQELAPQLDAVVNRLRQDDRQIVLLRFYERKSFIEIGEALGVSEEAVRKRVSRAVDKLRTNLGAAGATMPATLLTGILLAEVTKPAPAALAATIAATGAAATATTSTLLAKGAIAIMTWTKIKITAAFVVAVLLLAGGGAGVAIHFMAAPAPVVQKASAPPSLQSADENEYYMGGDVKRTGVYALGNRQISLWNALISAGLPDSGQNEWAVTLYRPHAPTKPAVILDNVLLSEFTAEPPILPPRRDGRPRSPPNPDHMWPEGPNLPLQAGDQIMLVPAAKILDQQWVWGPVHDVTLSMNGNAKRCLNFEENKLLDIPDSFLDRIKDSYDYIQWTIDSGADVLAWFNGTSLVQQLVATLNGYDRPWKWDEITPQLARLELRNKVTPPKMVQSFDFLQYNEFAQPISLFRTRSGRPGKVQLLKQSNEAGTILIRFCVAERVEPATKPATQP